MNGTNRTLAAMVLAAAPFVLGACAPKTKGAYLAPERPSYHLIGQKKVTVGAIEKTIDNIKVSGILDSKYLASMGAVKFLIKPTLEGITACFDNGTYVFFQPGPQLPAPGFESDYRIKSDDLMGHMLHEFCHGFFAKMPKERQDEFYALVKQYEKQYLQLYEDVKQNPFTPVKRTKSIFEDPKEIDGKPSPIIIPDEIFARYGFNLDTFVQFDIFMIHEEFYKKYYGEHFDKMFYGTEAFAQLARMDMEARAIIMKFDAEDKTGKKPEPHNALYGLSHVPQKLVPFYKGFFHPKFFEAK
jgi:hypothetical protein